jgi:two-component system chemotaxis sensor kinase CheA
LNEPTSRLLQLFLDEIEERVDVFDRDLLAFEASASQSERADLVTSLLRGAHSLKGAAASVRAGEIESVCHSLEDLLTAVRDGRVDLDAERINLLFAASDALRENGRCVRAGESGSQAFVALVPRIDAAAHGTLVVAPLRDAPAAVSMAAPAGRSPQARDGTVRVAAEKLDRLLEQSGELLVAWHRTQGIQAEVATIGEAVRALKSEWNVTGRERRSRVRIPERLRDLDRSFERLSQTIAADGAMLERAARRVDSEVRRIRMLPFALAVEGLERIVRDVAQTSGKNARLTIRGGEIELDRSILDGLRDPLVHLVRNAIDHGIESPERRATIGKSAQGEIVVTAALQGGGVEVTVADDGAGLDLPAIRKRAHERGFSIEDHDIAEAVFLPGVSTAREITGLSGRGVGLDAVRSALDALRGSVSVSSEPRGGTSFVLTLPLTLTTLPAILFDVAGQAFALDAAAVTRVARIDPANVAQVEGRPVIVGEDESLPLVHVRAVFGLVESESAARVPFPVLIVKRGNRRVAVRVDALLDQREVVVHALGARLASAKAVSGATILPDGSVALIARTAFLLERSLHLAQTLRAPVLAPESTLTQTKRILLVDDSITTRTLERSILEAAGYEVVGAADGEDAWRLLSETDFDLVLSDVDMPRMDGFSLVQAIRASSRMRDVPVILVTGRDTEADRRRGVEAGADAYVTKGEFDQRALLETIGDLL